MEWASALSVKESWEEALEQIVVELRRQLSEPPDLVFGFVSPVHAVRMPEMGAALRRAFPGARVLACTASGTIGAHRGIEHSVSLSCSAAVMPGVELELIHLSATHTMRGGIGPGRTEPDVQGVVVFADPHTCKVQEVLQSLERRYPNATIVGGGSSGGTFQYSNMLWCDDQTHRDGAVIAVLRGNVIIDAVVSQGCQPIGEPMIVTETRGDWITRVDRGHPAAIARSLFSEVEDRFQQAMRRALFLGIALHDNPTGEYHAGDFLVRKIQKTDPDGGGIMTRARPRRFEVIQFHVLEPGAARLELHTLCARHRTEHPGVRVRGALLFACLSRGQSLFGVSDHDTRVIREYFGTTPVGGFFCNGEYGPVGGRVFVHGYTSTLALFRERDS